MTRCKPVAPVIALVLLGCAARVPPPVVFLSDFGTADDSVAICKGVMLGIEPRLRIVDLTHDVRPYSIADGARLLAGTAPYYPSGTVFLAVVDPGVGSARRAIVALSRRGQYFVVPDNGLLTPVADRDGIREAREIADPGWLGPARSSTFHGRDVFAPVAARIARGEDWTRVGPPVERLARIDVGAPRIEEGRLVGTVVALDGPYGNLVTDVGGDALARLGWALGDRVQLTIGAREFLLRFVRTFDDVPAGEALLYVDSHGRVAAAVNRGSFAERYGVEPPVPLAIWRHPP